jgi:hypothetical protein
MNVTGLILKDANRFIHEAVYRPAATRECRELVEDFGSPLYDRVAIKSSRPHVLQSAARIVFIHERTQALSAAAINLLSDEPWFGGRRPVPHGLAQIDVRAQKPAMSAELQSCRAGLFDIHYCTPNQGFFTDSGREKPKSCKQYRLCPWCRYKKTREIFESLLPLLDPERRVCVTHYFSPCCPEALDLNTSLKAGEKVCRSIRDARSWPADYVITLPHHVRSADRYRLVWRTSLIAVVNKDELFTPLDDLAPKKIRDATFLSDGVVYRHAATSKGLSQALARVTAYPRWMLSKSLSDELLADLLTVLLAGDRNRAVAHGLRGAPDARIAEARL